MTGDRLSPRIVQVSQLPVQISVPQSCSWAQDNRLAMATQKGVYVFRLVPDPVNTQPKLNFVKTFIENDVDVNPWQLECVVGEDLLSQLPRQVKNDVMLDRVLSPHMAGGEQRRVRETSTW